VFDVNFPKLRHETDDFPTKYNIFAPDEPEIGKNKMTVVWHNLKRIDSWIWWYDVKRRYKHYGRLGLFDVYQENQATYWELYYNIFNIYPKLVHPGLRLNSRKTFAGKKVEDVYTFLAYDDYAISRMIPIHFKYGVNSRRGNLQSSDALEFADEVIFPLFVFDQRLHYPETYSSLVGSAFLDVYDDLETFQSTVTDLEDSYGRFNYYLHFKDWDEKQYLYCLWDLVR